MARCGSMVVNLGGGVNRARGVGEKNVRRTGSFLHGRPYQQPVRIALQGAASTHRLWKMHR
jgi:hypothetical protein